MDRNLGEAVPLLGGGAGFPTNTLSPGRRPTITLSFILIHPTVCHNTPIERQDKTDRQPSDNTGRTVLQTVAQKRPQIVENLVKLFASTEIIFM